MNDLDKIVCIDTYDEGEGIDLGYECYKVTSNIIPENVFIAFEETIQEEYDKENYNSDEILDAFSKKMEGTLEKVDGYIRRFPL